MTDDPVETFCERWWVEAGTVTIPVDGPGMVLLSDEDLRLMAKALKEHRVHGG